CIGPKSPRTVADIFPLDNGPAILRSIQRIFGAHPGVPTHPGPRRHKAPTARASRDAQTQRAGIAPLRAFISVPASFVGGVPLTRAMNPWAMPEASTKRPVIFPCELIPLSDVKVDPGKSKVKKLFG